MRDRNCEPRGMEGADTWITLRRLLAAQRDKRVYGVESHHLESVRDGLSEWLEVPVCPDCHRGPNGIHGLSRRAFYLRYKLDDLSLLAGTLKLAAQRDFK